MDKQFDDLSKTLAEDVSRREALKKFGMGMTAILLAAIGIEPRASAQACTYNADCSATQQCCGGKCISRQDNNNCGACGIVCSPGYTCKKYKVTDYGSRVHGFYYSCG